MDQADQKPAQAPKTEAERRAERLQAALRDNLRRRKAAAMPPAHEKETPPSE